MWGLPQYSSNTFKHSTTCSGGGPLTNHLSGWTISMLEERHPLGALGLMKRPWQCPPAAEVIRSQLRQVEGGSGLKMSRVVALHPQGSIQISLWGAQGRDHASGHRHYDPTAEEDASGHCPGMRSKLAPKIFGIYSRKFDCQIDEGLPVGFQSPLPRA